MSEPQSPYEKPTLDKDLEKFSFIEASTQFVLMRSAAPGLAAIFLAMAAVLSSFFAGTSAAAAVIVAGAVLAGYMAMNIGANDVTNNVGAAVGAQAISLTGALAIAFVFEIAGAFLAGGHVVETIKSGIVDGASVPDADTMTAIMLAALLSAAIWVNLATWLNAPVSTTHSIVGGIMGAATAAAGSGAVDWHVLGQIVVSWITSPAIGAAIAIAFLWFIKETILYADDKVAAARRWLPPLLGLMAGAFLTYLLIVVESRVPGLTFLRAVAAGCVAGGLGYLWLRGAIARQSAGLENRNQSLRVLFRLPLVFSAAALSFAHGANDVSNAIGPLAAIVEAAGIQSVARNLDAPLWVTTIGAFGISVGLALFGPRLIRVVGTQITKLNPVRAFCVAMSAAITVIIASALGLPVSATHVVIGAVFGVGLFREWYTARSAKRRRYILARAEGRPEPAGEPARAGSGGRPHYRYLVRRSYLASILAAWLVTVPASGLVAALLVLLLRPVL
ncbi:MAG: inorganic phosphate transporter [Rhizobiaceae bacterium]|nr:inorganic phosphate transporter [Rhizobiaceae bacterium]